MRIHRYVLTTALALAAAAPAQAQDIIYDRSNLLPHREGASAGANFIVATQFLMAGTFDVSAVRFWGGELNTSDFGDVQWYFHADNTDTPGAILASGTTSLTRTLLASDDQWSQFEYDFDLPVAWHGEGDGSPDPFWLALSIGNATNNNAYWQSTYTPGLRYQSSSDTFDGGYGGGGTLNTPGFQLIGTVEQVAPEPVSMILLGTGLAGILAVRLRRR